MIHWFNLMFFYLKGYLQLNHVYASFVDYVSYVPQGIVKELCK